MPVLSTVGGSCRQSQICISVRLPSAGLVAESAAWTPTDVASGDREEQKPAADHGGRRPQAQALER